MFLKYLNPWYWSKEKAKQKRAQEEKERNARYQKVLQMTIHAYSRGYEEWQVQQATTETVARKGNVIPFRRGSKFNLNDNIVIICPPVDSIFSTAKDCAPPDIIP